MTGAAAEASPGAVPPRRRFVALAARWCAGVAVLAAVPAPVFARRPAASAAGRASRILTGVITQVLDGDSVLLRPDDGGEAVEVRIAQIDAPERCQPWGAEAKAALTELALGKPATLRPRTRDRYGRTVARVTVDGVDLGRRMVEGGHAFSQRGRSDRGPLVKEERMARALRRGLHALSPPPQSPGQYRRSHPRGRGPCPAAGG